MNPRRFILFTFLRAPLLPFGLIPGGTILRSIVTQTAVRCTWN
jgi:hypothetical protein